MKKLLGKLLVVTITMAICFVAFGIFAYASGTFNKETPATVHITATNPDIAIYSDSNGTIPLTSIDFGSIDSGSSVSKHIYVKNIGNKDFSSVNITNDLDPAVGTITNANSFQLAKNQIYSVILTLNTLTSVTDSDPAIIITLTGTY